MNRWCSMTRRQMFASFAAAATTISIETVEGVRPTEAAAEAFSPVILGKGKYRYQVVENWGELPPVTPTVTPLPSASTVRITSTFSRAALIPSSSMIGTENSCAPGARISALPSPRCRGWS